MTDGCGKPGALPSDHTTNKGLRRKDEVPEGSAPNESRFCCGDLPPPSRLPAQSYSRQALSAASAG